MKDIILKKWTDFKKEKLSRKILISIFGVFLVSYSIWQLGHILGSSLNNFISGIKGTSKLPFLIHLWIVGEIINVVGLVLIKPILLLILPVLYASTFILCFYPVKDYPTCIFDVTFISFYVAALNLVYLCLLALVEYTKKEDAGGHHQ